MKQPRQVQLAVELSEETRLFARSDALRMLIRLGRDITDAPMKLSRRSYHESENHAERSTVTSSRSLWLEESGAPPATSQSVCIIFHEHMNTS